MSKEIRFIGMDSENLVQKYADKLREVILSTKESVLKQIIKDGNPEEFIGRIKFIKYEQEQQIGIDREELLVDGVVVGTFTLEFKRDPPSWKYGFIPISVDQLGLNKDVRCNRCNYLGPLRNYKPSFSVYNDIKCPACGSTNNQHNREYQDRLHESIKRIDENERIKNESM